MKKINLRFDFNDAIPADAALLNVMLPISTLMRPTAILHSALAGLSRMQKLAGCYISGQFDDINRVLLAQFPDDAQLRAEAFTIIGELGRILQNDPEFRIDGSANDNFTNKIEAIEKHSTVVSQASESMQEVASVETRASLEQSTSEKENPSQSVESGVKPKVNIQNLTGW